MSSIAVESTEDWAREIYAAAYRGDPPMPFDELEPRERDAWIVQAESCVDAVNEASIEAFRRLWS